ncbi:MAG: FtsW/RodA/SpoVE family cell cycle protein [Candidatus Yonathbacteria bacterium]|nr:FtsW/RodA/SpoVE family cell cycle protein [Candidatus Yonathbacteria bacterium]NTW47877.1 FtsW/RodA/SpoVE family cell cycle protein [Candidatus Yonathbacteria bacterium]
MHEKRVDRFFLGIVLLLVLGGFFIFVSASLGLHAREEVRFSSVIINQFGGLVLGLFAMFLISRIPVEWFRRYALHFFLFGVFASFLVFVPGLGMAHGGAKRWIFLGPVTFQPSELLKIGTIIYMSAWFAAVKSKAGTFAKGLMPFLVTVGIAGVVLLLQPDTDTFIVTAASALAVYVAAGAKWRHVAIVALLGVLVLGGVVLMRPYVLDRVKTFFNPSADTLDSGWQAEQSLTAIGSGGVIGKGFGQSSQKFGFLPEPIGDSIYAVAAEEFGFTGGLAIIVGFLLFLSRGSYIARRAKDPFSGLLVLGIVIMTVLQSFMNIAAMLAVFPLMGIPLLFISHGGSALLIILAEMGIVLSVSRHLAKV